MLGQITQIENASSGLIKDEASKFYSKDNDLRIYNIYPLVNIGIENLTVKRLDTGHAHNGSNVIYNLAVNCWIKGVKFNYTCEHHIQIKYSSHIEISGCFFDNARYKGNHGYGYGIDLAKSSTNCLVENNIFKRLRHSMVVQDDANANVFGYNYSREQEWECDGGCPDDYGADFLVHGDYAYGNLFEGNVGRRFWLDAAHGWNGPYNTFLRNRSTTSSQEWIMVWNAHKTNIIGNYNVIGVTKDQSGIGGFLLALVQEWDIRESNDVTDIYFHTYPDQYPWTGWSNTNHAEWYAVHDDGFYSTWYLNRSFLNDISYYYDSKPSFLSGYSWPASYPNVNLDYNEYIEVPYIEIPAEDRYYNSTVKTYLPYPTTSVITSGTLQNDENWSGIINITGSVTVPSGITLTILPGTEVRFHGYKSIYVHGGTLIADGATFTANDPSQIWNKLEFKTSSTSSLENCTISSGNIALFIWNVDIHVKKCTISNSNLGVYIYGSTANTTIEECAIQDNDFAMYLYYGDPIIKNNKFNSVGESYSVKLYKCQGTFTNNTFKSRDGDGVYILGSTSIPNFEGETNGTGNYFTDCADTYLEIAGGNPELGFNTSGRYGYNLFEDGFFGLGGDGHAVNNQSGNTIYAQQNWWSSMESQGGYPSGSYFFFGSTPIYVPVCDKPNQVGALWKGGSETDYTGNVVPSGLYFVNLRTNSGCKTLKISLIK